MIFSRDLCFLILALYSMLERRLCVGNFSKHCEVTVAPPWEVTTYIPQGSSVHVRCTATNNRQRPTWSINPASSENFLPISLLSQHGFYEIPQDDVAVIELIMNTTMDINGTVIRCIDTSSSNFATIYETTLYVPTAITYSSEDVAKQVANISWSSLPIANQTYIMSVKNKSGYMESFKLYEPYYLFTAPEGAPPCEVYNFSVTATYVGANYTGAGCSVLSPVLSRMLPSLPYIIASWESSLNYSLKKNSSGGFALRVTFMPANYCDMYPVTSYVLEVEGPTSCSDIIQSPSNDTLSVNNLLDNQAYSFIVVVSNSVGNVSTGKRIIYTTDVQTVKALPSQEDKSFLLQCNFMVGSNARGCVVILMSNFGNETRNLTRNGTQSLNVEAAVNATHPLSCYTAVYGFDIESDGSVGTLAVSGVIMTADSINVPCVPEELKPRPSHNIPTWVIIITGVVLGVILVSITVIVVSYCLVRRSRTEKHSNYYHVSRPSPTSSAGPAPVTPPPAPTQDFTDEDDDTKKPQPIYDQPEKITIPKEEHSYHVLETCTPRYQFQWEDFQHKPGNRLIPPHAHDAQSPTHSVSDSSPCDPPPVYQDIADVPLVRDRHSGRAGASGQEIHSSSTELPPVYHEITELQPSSRASSRLHDDVPSAGTNI